MRSVILIAATMLMSVDARAQGCADLPDAQMLQGAQHALAFRTLPERIAVGQHFSVELQVCPKASGAAADAVKVDAYMPEHRHGMNYKPAIKALGAGRYRADGLMFHMPGRWEFRFDIESQGKTERLSATYALK